MKIVAFLAISLIQNKMTQTLTVTGMTCEACEYKIQHLFSGITGVKSATPNRAENAVLVETTENISLANFQEVLKPFTKYSVSEKVVSPLPTKISEIEKQRTWFETYKPILLIFAYITAISLIASTPHRGAGGLFMAGFFLVFSFFKLLNLKGFAESYAMYDVLAKKIPVWGYIYAFVELGLGVAFLTNFQPFLTNIITLVVMSISIIGVLQSVLNKKQIQCACLGAVFNLPMSTVTIIEDALMIAMSGGMLLMM